MSDDEAWLCLGLAPTRDARAVKRAYAQVLKRQRAHDYAAAFTRLREAYAWALAHCEEAVEPPPPAMPAAEREGATAEASRSAAPQLDPPVLPAEAELPTALTQLASDEAPPETPTPHPRPFGNPSFVRAWQGQAHARVARARIEWATSPLSLAELDATIAHAHQQTYWAHPMPAVLAQEEAWARYWCQGPLQGVHPSEGLDLLTAVSLSRLPTPPFPPVEPLPMPQWLRLGQALCDHYGWGQAPSRQGQAVATQLCSAWAEHLTTQGLQDPSAAAQLLHSLLVRALWHAPAWRQALGLALVRAWAQRRLGWSDWAQALTETFDVLHDLPARRDLAVAALCEAWLGQQDSHLLQRVARGEQEHPHIPKAVAQALRQPHVRPEDRKAVMAEGTWGVSGLPWQVVVRNTLAWLESHAPDALQSIDPAVLAWWQRHHVQEHFTWPLAAMALGFYSAFSAAEWAKGWMRGEPGTDALAILSWCLGLAVGATLGWWGAALVAWLRLRWACGPYQRWLAWDRRLGVCIAQALPWWPQASRSSRWGWSRHGLPMALVFTQQWASLAAQTPHPSAPPDAWWEVPVVALCVTLFVGWLWSRLLRWVGSA